MREMITSHEGITFLIISKKQFFRDKRYSDFLPEIEGFSLELIKQIPNEDSTYKYLIYKINPN